MARPVHSQAVTEADSDTPVVDERDVDERDVDGRGIGEPDSLRERGQSVPVRDRAEAYERAQIGRASAADQLKERSASSGRQPVDPRWAALDSSMAPERPRRSFRRVLVILFLIAAVLAAAVAGWWLIESGSASPGTVEVPAAETAAAETAVDDGPAPAEAGETDVVEQASAAPTPAGAEDTEDNAGDAAVAPEPVAVVETIRTVPAIPELIVQIDGETVVADASGVIDVSSFAPDSIIEVVGVWTEPALIQIELLEWSDRSRSPLRRLADVAGPEVLIGFEVRRQVVVEVEDSEFAPDSVWFQSPRSDDVIVPVGEPTWVASRRSRFVDGTPAVEIIEYQVAPFQGLSTADVYRPVDLAVWDIDRR